MLAELVIPLESLTSEVSPINDLGTFISQGVGVALVVAGIAMFLYLVIGGIQWTMAGDDKAKIEEARHRITNALIGLGIVATSWAIFILIDYFFGLGLVDGGSASTNTSQTQNGNNGNNNGNNGTNNGSNGSGTCIYPTSRCCDDISDSTCFCQNPNYRAVAGGSCPAEAGNIGVLCSCEPN